MNVSIQDLLLNIENSIKNKKPLSVVRCGDGEFHLVKTIKDFNERDVKIHRSAINNILKRNNIWQCKTHEHSCECYLKSNEALAWIGEIRGYIVNAMKSSDYLGLTVPGKDIRFYGISNEILRGHGIDPVTKKTINSLFPRSHEFGSLSNFRNLIQGNGIHIITSNVERFKNINLGNILGVNVTYTDISGKRSYKQRTFIKESIIESNKKIFLFGGGSAIKDLIPWSAKTMGAVSIDVGSVLDVWSGYRSRLMYLQPEFQHLLWIK
jgi:hypothetical protein